VDSGMYIHGLITFGFGATGVFWLIARNTNEH
jgi:hypothetical protein